MDLIMKKGAHGSEVQTLQRQLNAHGAQLAIDGWFDASTEAAVAAFQRQAGLVVDGIAGAKTLTALAGQADKKALRESDLQAAADRLGVDLACIKAVNQVESRGHGFLDGGCPVILLERHVAYARAKEAGMPLDGLVAKYPNLVNPARGGYAGGQAEWARFDNLRRVTAQEIAVESCSWGLFQIMGFHWQALGYASALVFQEAMFSSEAEQLDAFVRFILGDPSLLKALKAKKWTDFARLYNGPAYKENLYDAKLAAAYAKAEGVAA